MQKIFRKYMILITTAAILSILIIHYHLTMYLIESQQANTFQIKISQIIHTLENNQTELASIKNNLDEDYLTRTKAAKYLLEKNPDLLTSVTELENLAAFLGVDQLHITDNNGIIVHSSHPLYIGMDLHDDERTAAFLSILESHDEEAYFIQEAQPNIMEDAMMKYIGVARTGGKGIIQVGLEPTRELQAQARNTYHYIFSRFPTDIGEVFFAIDCNAGKVIAHSDGTLHNHMEEYYHADRFLGCENGAYRKMENNQMKYIVTRQYGDVLIGASISKDNLRSRLWNNILPTFIYLLFIAVIIILLLNYLVKRKVVDGIHNILKSLSDITNGNLDTTVMVSGNPEFQQLSNGINTMVKGIVNAADRTSKIIGMTQIPLAAFEYQKSMKHVFITPGLKDLLDLSCQDISVFRENPDIFYKKIQEIMENPMPGEKDIFQINGKKYVHIRFAAESDGYLGAITDVTKDVLDKRRILYENSHDQLTSLNKYQSFKQQAAAILANMPYGEIAAFVMLDLDSFKNVNDTYGHDTGDRYLQHFASVMQTMPEEHCLTSRRSGDEFCMMLFGCHQKNEIIGLLDFFFETLKNSKIDLNGIQAISIKASAGFSYTAGDNTDVSLLLHQADQALYKAKKEKKGNYAEYFPQ